MQPNRSPSSRSITEDSRKTVEAAVRDALNALGRENGLPRLNWRLGWHGDPWLLEAWPHSEGADGVAAIMQWVRAAEGSVAVWDEPSKCRGVWTWDGIMDSLDVRFSCVADRAELDRERAREDRERDDYNERRDPYSND